MFCPRRCSCWKSHKFRSNPAGPSGFPHGTKRSGRILAGECGSTQDIGRYHGLSEGWTGTPSMEMPMEIASSTSRVPLKCFLFGGEQNLSNVRLPKRQRKEVLLHYVIIAITQGPSSKERILKFQPSLLGSKQVVENRIELREKFQSLSAWLWGSNSATKCGPNTGSTGTTSNTSYFAQLTCPLTPLPDRAKLLDPALSGHGNHSRIHAWPLTMNLRDDLKSALLRQ